MSYISAFPTASTTLDFGLEDAGWSSSTRIFTNDDLGAVTGWGSSDLDGTTEYLRGFAYSLSIPAASTVQGIEVEVEVFSASSNQDVEDGGVQLVRGSTRVGNIYASSSDLLWPTAFEVRRYGGPNDLWGTTWAPSDINSTDFGVDFRAFCRNPLFVSNARVDYISVTVHWVSGGTAFITFTPSATIQASAELAGAATITFSPSGILHGTAELGGSATIVFTPTASISAVALASGASTITFTASATMVADAALAGTATITFTPSGLLIEHGKLSGTATITFTPSAAIEAVALTSGSATVTFSGSGTLSADAALAGNVTIIFSPSATLVAEGALAGTGTITFSASGMYDVPPEKALKYRSRPHVTLAGGQRANVR